MYIFIKILAKMIKQILGRVDTRIGLPFVFDLIALKIGIILVLDVQNV